MIEEEEEIESTEDTFVTYISHQHWSEYQEIATV